MQAKPLEIRLPLGTPVEFATRSRADSIYLLLIDKFDI
jgi:hypothetical protein